MGSVKVLPPKRVANQIGKENSRIPDKPLGNLKEVVAVSPVVKDAYLRIVYLCIMYLAYFCFIDVMAT